MQRKRTEQPAGKKKVKKKMFLTQILKRSATVCGTRTLNTQRKKKTRREFGETRAQLYGENIICTHHRAFDKVLLQVPLGIYRVLPSCRFCIHFLCFVLSSHVF